jgi:DNA processing protein
MYPAAHATIAKDMLANNGGLLTDFTSGSKIDPGNFLRRNRIIAGLADCTIVVESATKGGAMVTADIASSYNREVFAYPGRTTDSYSSGCNDLIKRNVAGMIETSTDLMNLMGWKTKQQPTQQSLFLDFSEEELLILKYLQKNEIATVDDLAHEVNMAVQKINPLLLNLEFNGVVKSLPGNRFKIKNKLII